MAKKQKFNVPIYLILVLIWELSESKEQKNQRESAFQLTRDCEHNTYSTSVTCMISKPPAVFEGIISL